MEAKKGESSWQFRNGNGIRDEIRVMIMGWSIAQCLKMAQKFSFEEKRAKRATFISNVFVVIM